MRKTASLLTMLMLFCALAFAQLRNVSGVVRDSNGNPIPFATVTEAGTNNATQANESGVFTISVKEGARLTVTSTGFAPVTITPGAGSQTITLTATDASLQEVVVTTALGVRKQPRELGYSTARVTNRELTQAAPVNVQAGLTGKVSGLNISTVNNSVFGDTRITLRGIRSLTGNNQPLLVIDGSQAPLDQLNRLNPNDIEDVTILKGSNAAALYGPDGVNGVILVKTLRGSRTGQPVVKISNATQFERVSFLPKFQTQFGSGSSVNPATGIGVYDPFENQQYGDPYDGTVREIGRPLEDGTLQTETYAYKPDGRLNFFETGVTLQNDISYAAKNFYLSVQDVNIKGTLGGDKNRRTTFRFNGGNEYGRFRANYNIAYTKQAFNVASVSPYWEVFNTAGHIDLGQYKNWRDAASTASPNHYFNEYYQNPYFVKDRTRSNGNNDDITAQLETGLQITDWLNATARVGTILRNRDYTNTGEAFTFSNYAKNVTHKNNASSDIKASVAEGASKYSRITSDVYLSAQKTFGDFTLEGLVGHSFRQDKNHVVDISGSNLIIPTLYNVSNRTGEAGVGESEYLYRLIGAYGRFQVGYKNWAFLEFTGRNDWDSRLPVNNRSFFYPGVNASVVLSDAIPALQGSGTISYLKVRGSVSKSGNVNLGTAFGGAYQLEPIFNPAGGFPYGNLPGFQAATSLNNPNINPEFVNSKELGLEISFLRNRINLEVSGYLQNNTNQILDVQVSRATGITSATLNAADFDNKGLEFDLRLTPLVELGDFRFDLRGNYSLMDSRVNSVYEGLDEIGISQTTAYGMYAMVGQPAFMLKTTDYKRDPEGRIIVDPFSGYPSLDPALKVMGRTLPKHMIGINPSFGWKGLSLSLTADYRGGHVVAHGIGPDMDFTGSSLRSGRNGRQRFVVPNSSYFDGSKYVPNTSILTANGGYGFYENSNINRGIWSNYVTSAAAWKLREVALGYMVPSSILGRTKIVKGATVSLIARNLVTLVPESNEWTDPEFSSTTGNAVGVNNTNNLPPNRLYGFNIVLEF